MIGQSLFNPWNLSWSDHVVKPFMIWKMNVSIWSLKLNDSKQSTRFSLNEILFHVLCNFIWICHLFCVFINRIPSNKWPVWKHSCSCKSIAFNQFFLLAHFNIICKLNSENCTRCLNNCDIDSENRVILIIKVILNRCACFNTSW